MQIPAHLRSQVVERARQRCECCGLAQEGQEATFHVDHAVPVVAGGETTLDNLALVSAVTAFLNPMLAGNDGIWGPVAFSWE